jgi:spoIIIJ-associated protein
MQSIEVAAKTVEEAITLAGQQLHTTEDNLAIEVLEPTPGKFLSIFSSRRAKIRAALKSAPIQADRLGAAHEALETLKVLFDRIVRHIDPAARIETATSHDEVIFNIIGDGSGIFIGKKGQTLEALQYLLNKIRARQAADMPHILVDSEGYRSRHVENLESLAMRLGEKAKKKGGTVITPPLNAADRRIIHMKLKHDTSLTTWSKGEGVMRKVIIAPRQ